MVLTVSFFLNSVFPFPLKTTFFLVFWNYFKHSFSDRFFDNSLKNTKPAIFVWVSLVKGFYALFVCLNISSRKCYLFWNPRFWNPLSDWLNILKNPKVQSHDQSHDQAKVFFGIAFEFAIAFLLFITSWHVSVKTHILPTCWRLEFSRFLRKTGLRKAWRWSSCRINAIVIPCFAILIILPGNSAQT